MSLKHIIWDWNGTLLDDIDLALGTMITIMEEHDIEPITKEIYLEKFGFPVREYYEKIGFDLQNTSHSQVSNQFVTAYRHNWKDCGLHQSVKETLDGIQALGLTQSILSAAEQKSLYEILDRFELRDYLTHAIGLDNHEAGGKVQRGLDWITTERMDTNHMLLIGDTLHDKEVADALGCKSVLVAHGHQSKERLMKAGVPVLDNLNEVLAYIKENK